MPHRPCQPLARVSLFALLLTTAPAGAAEPPLTGDRGGDMAVDLMVMRPLGLVGTLLGSAAFVVGLPFTLPTGGTAEAACQLIKRPAAYTFARPLGDFEEDRELCPPSR